jgi:hypothetical protein
MRITGLLIAFMALSLFVLPGLTAQEKKGDDAKAEKKDTKDEKKDAKDEKKDAKDEKKDPEKTDPEKKDPPKEKEKKEKKPVEEKPEHGPVVKTKIISMKADSAHEFTVEVSMPDPTKIAAVQMWSMQQIFNISRTQNAAQRAQQMYQYQMQLAIKQANETTTMKPFEVRAAEKCKVRMMYPPVQYDDAGNLKKYTQKELAAMKANSKLPGFPADFDLLKTGQYVELYMAKPPPAAKSTGTPPPMKKKKMEDDPDVPVAVPEVVMIVIWAEPMGR